MGRQKISGTEFRRLRHSLGLTLEETSRGICSVAYLSLIEQGQREASERMGELLLARLTAAESDAGVAVQLTALKVAEHEVRQHGVVGAATRDAAPLKNHQLLLQALESEAAGELSTAIGQLDQWLSEHPTSRDLQSFGSRLRVRMLRAASLDAEAIQFASKFLAGADTSVKSRQPDLLEIAFQLAGLYAEAGAWSDAIRLLEKQEQSLVEPKHLLNAHWAKSDILYGKGDVQAALAEVTSALAEAEALDVPATEAKLRNNMLWYELLSGQIDVERQLPALLEIEQTMREAGNAGAVASILSTRALLAARLGNSSEVHELAAAATGASVNTATRSHEELLLSLGEITLSIDSRDLAEAALEFIDRRKRNVLPSRAEANLLFRAGQLATRLGAFERANDYLTTALHFIGFNSVTP